jgi:hypothetical protein
MSARAKANGDACRVNLIGALVRSVSLMFLLVAASSACSQTGIDDLSTDTILTPGADFGAGHGSLSIDYSHPFFHGDYVGPAAKDSGQVSFQTVDLEAAYFVADRWELRLGLPFSRAKYSGNFAHPQLPCPPNCAPVFVDNGDYHSSWVDWDAGVSYHAVVGDNYYVTPSADLYVPSNNYQYYGSAVVGQRLTKFGTGVLVQHQLDFSDLYFAGHFQYVFMPKTLGINADYYDFGFDFGYFINPQVGIRAVSDVKIGYGHTDNQINASCCSGPLWALHDKFRMQDHANIGGAIDYTFNDSYLLSATLTRSIWGLGNAVLVYDIDLKLTRSF